MKVFAKRYFEENRTLDENPDRNDANKQQASPQLLSFPNYEPNTDCHIMTARSESQSKFKTERHLLYIFDMSKNNVCLSQNR